MSRPLICLAIMAVLNLTLQAHAGIISKGVFTGQYSETWESFDNFTVGPDAINYLASTTAILGGIAEIVNPTMVIYEATDPAGFGLVDSGDFAQVSDGIKGMGVNNSPFFPDVNTLTRINFSTPIYAFEGETGYWAPNPAPIEVRFFDLANNLLGIETFFYSRNQQFDGVLEWHGWQSTEAIGAIEYIGSYVVNDGLQVSTVPEPSSLCIVCTLIASGLFLRKRRMDQIA